MCKAYSASSLCMITCSYWEHAPKKINALRMAYEKIFCASAFLQYCYSRVFNVPYECLSVPFDCLIVLLEAIDLFTVDDISQRKF